MCRFARLPGWSSAPPRDQNLNSFRFLERAINAEIRYQTRLIGRRRQGATNHRAVRPGRRRKPAPCAARKTPTITATSSDPGPAAAEGQRRAEVDAIRADMPGTAAGRDEARALSTALLSAYDAGLLTHSLALARYFETAAESLRPGLLVANWVNGEGRAA